MDYSQYRSDLVLYLNYLQIGGIISYRIDKTYTTNQLTNQEEPLFSITIEMRMVAKENVTTDYYSEQPATISITRNGYGIDFPVLKMKEVHETIKDDRAIYLTITCVGKTYTTF